MDATMLLTSDHNEVRGLFRQAMQAEQAGDTARMTELVRTITQELEIHTQIEEEVFYPPARREGGKIAELIEEGIQEHNEADDLIQRIRGMSPGDARFSSTLQELHDAVEHHASEEENELFPKLREHWDTSQRERLGTALQEAKARIKSGRGADDIDLTKDELYEKAKEQGVEGRSKMNKEELARAVGEK
jgi:iron-sulfur cluster repair protein YtfE (RIC family)